MERQATESGFQQLQIVRIALLTIFLFLESSLKAQEESFTLRCLSVSYERTHNVAFENNSIRCRNELNGDTLIIN